MSASMTLPPGVALRDFLLGVIHKRRAIFFVIAAILVGTLQLAFSIVPNFKARSTLLVLMGPEYMLRPTAGQQTINSGGVDAEQVLRTEASILASVDLHRSVIREIGLPEIYPQLLEPPGPLRAWWDNTFAAIKYDLGISAKPEASAAADPLVRAAEKFADNLNISVDRKSSVITLDFTHPEKAQAIRTLDILEQHYLKMRASLYGDVQAPIVAAQRNRVSQDLTNADVALQDFKRTHDISSFSDRRTILMKQQGDLEAAVAKAQAEMAEQQARIDQLNAQLTVIVGAKKGATPNAAAALQNMVEAYRRREGTVQNTYRGSTSADDAHRQMLERETDIAKMQSTQAFNLQADRDKAEAQLKASSANYATASKQLTAINLKVATLDGDETELHRLERGRGILEDNYKAVSKILDERQVVETVDANRQSSIRVIQPPTAPAYPQPTRRLILIAGAILTVLATIGVALLSHFLRVVYFRSEALELETGLTVLASIPDSRLLGRSPLAIAPSSGGR